jgi:LuxR family quorum-sensing system transcriptional regulator CciR
MRRSLIQSDIAVIGVIQEFIDRCRRLTSQAELHALLEDIARELGFLYFALISHVDLRDKKPWIINLNNYPPPWAEYFIRNALYRIDPVVRTCFCTNAAFAWSEMHRHIYLNTQHRDIVARAACEGVANGLTIPGCVVGEYSGSCSFATPRKGSVEMAHLMACQLVGTFAFEAARRLVKDLAPLLTPQLSRRQRECAVLAGRGMKAQAIAHDLDLSAKTVSNYLDGARRRYHVHSCEQLLVHALLNGEINLIELDTRR